MSEVVSLRSIASRVTTAGSIAALLTGCTTGGTAFAPPVQPTNVAKSAKLQLAVGTATIGYNGGAALGTNFVVTFRGADGNNATGANTPTLTGPPGFSFGPNLGNSNSITGVLPSQFTEAAQNSSQPSPYPYPASYGEGFGPFTGAFGYGFSSNNTVSNTVSQTIEAIGSGKGVCFGIAVVGFSPNVEASTGVPALNGGNSGNLPPTNVVHSAALGLPIPSGQTGNAMFNNCPYYADSGASPFNDGTFPVNYYGGPPAWPSAQGYGNPGYFLGYPLGFTDFAERPVAGTYSLDVAYATSADYSTYGHATATATLNHATGLPPFAGPTLTVNSDGSGVVAVDVPAGVTEAVVMVRTADCDLVRTFNSILQADNYAVVVRSPGRQLVTFSSNLGPPDGSGQPKHTFCTNADLAAANATLKAEGYPAVPSASFTPLVTAVGFDYPAYEASYPFDLTSAPTIVNGAGQADVTTSYPVNAMYTIVDPTVTGSSIRR